MGTITITEEEFKQLREQLAHIESQRQALQGELRSKRSIDHVLANAEGLCVKQEFYWVGSAMRQGSNAS